MHAPKSWKATVEGPNLPLWDLGAAVSKEIQLQNSLFPQATFSSSRLTRELVLYIQNLVGLRGEKCSTRKQSTYTHTYCSSRIKPPWPFFNKKPNYTQTAMASLHTFVCLCFWNLGEKVNKWTYYDSPCPHVHILTYCIPQKYYYCWMSVCTMASDFSNTASSNLLKIIACVSDRRVGKSEWSWASLVCRHRLIRLIMQSYSCLTEMFHYVQWGLLPGRCA